MPGRAYARGGAGGCDQPGTLECDAYALGQTLRSVLQILPAVPTAQPTPVLQALPPVGTWQPSPVLQGLPPVGTWQPSPVLQALPPVGTSQPLLPDLHFVPPVAGFWRVAASYVVAASRISR